MNELQFEKEWTRCVNDIIETYVYRATITDFNFSTASAVGLYQSIIGFVMVMAVNFIVKKIDPDYSLF